MMRTERDEIAKAALNGMLAHPKRYKPRPGDPANWHAAIAKEAYEIADAMLVEREKGGKMIDEMTDKGKLPLLERLRAHRYNTWRDDLGPDPEKAEAADTIEFQAARIAELEAQLSAMKRYLAGEGSNPPRTSQPRTDLRKEAGGE